MNEVNLPYHTFIKILTRRIAPFTSLIVRCKALTAWPRARHETRKEQGVIREGSRKVQFGDRVFSGVRRGVSMGREVVPVMYEYGH